MPSPAVRLTQHASESISEAKASTTTKAVEHLRELAYLATVLPVADILDFDRERTPDELYRSISFTNPISIRNGKAPTG